jgi:hypothetical protein
MKRDVGFLLGGLVLTGLLVAGLLMLPQMTTQQTEEEADPLAELPDAWTVAARSCVYVSNDGTTPNYDECEETAEAREGDTVYFYHQLMEARRTGGTIRYTKQADSEGGAAIEFQAFLSHEAPLEEILGEQAGVANAACTAFSGDWPAFTPEGILLTDKSPVYKSIGQGGALGLDNDVAPLCQFTVPKVTTEARVEAILFLGPADAVWATRAIVTLVP